MKTKSLFTMATALLMVAGLSAPSRAELPAKKMTAFTPHQITTPDKVVTPAGTWAQRRASW